MRLKPLIDAINYDGIVSGLTHDLYRYPARFSPKFARAAIEAFSTVGDTVLDPFMGGSTTLVESLALGRNAIGTDLNQLAVFLGKVKTRLLSERDLHKLKEWVMATIPELSPRRLDVSDIDLATSRYQVNMPWRIRKLAEQTLASACESLDARLLDIARCLILKSSQWAVDCRKTLPTATEFRQRLLADSDAIASSYRSLRAAMDSLACSQPRIEAHLSSCVDIASIKSKILHESPAKLIVTSPPYPGVHVLYHRWQVLGRRETGAPYWIAAQNDGQGASYYTFCDRKSQSHDERYFERLQSCFSAIRQVVRDDCVVAQLVGFARPDEQLPLYLQAMSEAGFKDYAPPSSGYSPKRKEFWRSVPNRKWYNAVRGERLQSREILLLHRSR